MAYCPVIGGQCFWRWRKVRLIKPGLPRGCKAFAEPADLMTLPLVNESIVCLRMHVVETADLLDSGVIFGAGFTPLRGGPMHYAQQKGDAGLKQRLGGLEQRHGSQVYADAGWRMARF